MWRFLICYGWRSNGIQTLCATAGLWRNVRLLAFSGLVIRLIYLVLLLLWLLPSLIIGLNTKRFAHYGHRWHLFVNRRWRLTLNSSRFRVKFGGWLQFATPLWRVDRWRLNRTAFKRQCEALSSADAADDGTLPRSGHCSLLLIVVITRHVWPRRAPWICFENIGWNQVTWFVWRDTWQALSSLLLLHFEAWRWAGQAEQGRFMRWGALQFVWLATVHDGFQILLWTDRYCCFGKQTKFSWRIILISSQSIISSYGMWAQYKKECRADFKASKLVHELKGL